MPINLKIWLLGEIQRLNKALEDTNGCESAQAEMERGSTWPICSGGEDIS